MKDAVSEFYELTLIDPLFAAEGVDLDNAFCALQELEKVTSQLEIINTTTIGRLYFFLHPLPSILHPFGFLKNFFKSEQARRHFLACPCFDHAKKIIEIYYRTVNALEKDLNSYRSACLKAQERTISKKPNAKAYNFYCSKVSFEDFISCIELMLKNSYMLRKEVDKRNLLLLSSLQTGFFKKTRHKGTEHRIENRQHVASIAQQNGSKKKLSSRLLEFAKLAEYGRDYMYYLEKRYVHISSELVGPISYKLSQFDGEPTNHQFFLSLVKDKSGAARGIFAILADQFHFLELAEDKYKFYADIFIYESLIKRGIPYWYQPATSFYFTSDLRYYADLATMIDLKTRPYLNKSLILDQKSSMLDLLLWNGYFHNLSYLLSIKARARAGKKLNNWHYLLVGRSYASLYYLSFNKSVWRLNVNPNFLGTPTKKQAFYLTHDKLPKTLKRSQIQSIFKGGRIRAEDVDAAITDFSK